MHVSARQMESSTAGQSNSIESSESRPSTSSSSSGPAAIDSSGSEPADSHAEAWPRSRRLIEQANR